MTKRIKMFSYVEKPEDLGDEWPGIFEALSVSHLAPRRELFKFPVPLPDQVRSIAQTFVVSFLSYIREPPPPSLGITPLDYSTSQEPEVFIWNATFRQLESIGFAEPTYQWGKRTLPNYFGQNNQIMDELHWDALLFDWAKDPHNPAFAKLPIAAEKIEALRAIIFKYAAHRKIIRSEIGEIRTSPKDAWDQFAYKELQVWAWLSNHAQFMATIDQWNEIFNTLQPHEITLLENWGRGEFERIGISSFPPIQKFTL